jgi:hypothetical protein
MTTPNVKPVPQEVHVPARATPVRTGSHDAYVLSIQGYKIVTTVGEVTYMELPVQTRASYPRFH